MASIQVTLQDNLGQVHVREMVVNEGSFRFQRKRADFFLTGLSAGYETQLRYTVHVGARQFCGCFHVKADAKQTHKHVDFFVQLHGRPRPGGLDVDKLHVNWTRLNLAAALPAPPAPQAQPGAVSAVVASEASSDECEGPEGSQCSASECSASECSASECSASECSASECSASQCCAARSAELNAREALVDAMLVQVTEFLCKMDVLQEKLDALRKPTL
jgi:hypothetical protein